MSNKALVVGVIFAVLVFPLAVAYAQFSQKNVTVEASAESKDEAVKKALRDAVEQGVGVLVDSETIVENNELLNDKIYTEVKGYVTSFKVLDEKKEEGGLTTVKVEAVVSLAELRKSIQGLKILLDEKDNPRFAVSFKEYIDGADLPSPELRPLFEKKLKEDKFEIIDVANLKR